jgi:hypothetical protein
MTVARKKTVFQGLSIGPDVELLLLVAGAAIGLYWVWEKWGSGALSSIGSDLSSATSDVTGAVTSAFDSGDDSSGE